MGIRKTDIMFWLGIAILLGGIVMSIMKSDTSIFIFTALFGFMFITIGAVQ